MFSKVLSQLPPDFLAFCAGLVTVDSHITVVQSVVIHR